MKKFIALFVSLVLVSLDAIAYLPAIPTPSNTNSSTGLIFSAFDATVTYGICAYSPGDAQHKAVICPPPFHTEKIAQGQHEVILVPNDKLDAAGNIITHYSAMITRIEGNALTWIPGPGISCGVNMATNNAIMITATDNAIICRPGKAICNDEQCQQPSDFQPLNH